MTRGVELPAESPRLGGVATAEPAHGPDDLDGPHPASRADDLDDLRDLYENAPCGYVSSGASGRIVRVNATLCSWLGRSPDEVLGRTLGDLLSVGSRTYFETYYRPMLDLRGRVDQVALDFARADGNVVPMLVNSVVLRDDAGRVRLTRTSLVDASERRSYERELVRARSSAQSSQRRLGVLHDAATAFASAADPDGVAAAIARSVEAIAPAAGVVVWVADPGGRLTKAFTTGRDQPSDPAVGGPDGSPLSTAWTTGEPVHVPSAQDAEDRWPHVAHHMRTTRVQSSIAVPLLLDGRPIGVYQAVYARMRSFPLEELETHRGLANGAGVALRRAQLQERLRHTALHDPLTGAGNRALFGDRLRRHLGCDAAAPVAVLVVDLDGFKHINDTLGHRAGDDVLRAVAARIGSTLGADDVLVRLGGDEFAVISPGTDEAGATRLAQAVVTAIGTPLVVGGRPTTVTCSTGVVVHRPGDEPGPVPTPEDVLHLADLALYRAKALGKNRYRLYDRALRAEAVHRDHIGGEIRRALREDDLVAWYQPVYDLPSGDVVGVEALCRIRSADALLQPGEFLDVAAENGMLAAIGSRMLTLGCRDVMVWSRQGHGDLSVAVNVAAEHAAHGTFADEVLGILDATGCPPERLTLELTESALLEANPRTLANLEALRAAGVGLALDDFGTRYASLQYVQVLPLTRLKIDRGFIAGIPSGRVATAIVHSVVSLARELGVTCVAEGIETQEQHDALADLGVLGQGYLLARPMPADEIPRALAGAGRHGPQF